MLVSLATGGEGSVQSDARRALAGAAVSDADREKLAASESELDDRVAELATRRGGDVGQLYASLQKAGRLKEIERSITEEKVFKWLLDQNTVE